MDLSKNSYGRKISDNQIELLREHTTVKDRLWACDQANQSGCKLTFNTLTRVITGHRSISKNNILALNLLLNIAKQTEISRKAIEMIKKEMEGQI